VGRRPRLLRGDGRLQISLRSTPSVKPFPPPSFHSVNDRRRRTCEGRRRWRWRRGSCWGLRPGSGRDRKVAAHSGRRAHGRRRERARQPAPLPDRKRRSPARRRRRGRREDAVQRPGPRRRAAPPVPRGREDVARRRVT
jgi:hypothetical protein